MRINIVLGIIPAIKAQIQYVNPNKYMRYQSSKNDIYGWFSAPCNNAHWLSFIAFLLCIRFRCLIKKIVHIIIVIKG